MRKLTAIKVSSSFLALICLCFGCASQPASNETLADIIYGGNIPPTRHEQFERLEPQLQNVTIDDGINSKEANIIAQIYFLRFGPSCGMAMPVTDDGGSWISTTYIGIGGTETHEPIRIDKHTGHVTWSSGPTIENPKAISN